MLDPTLAGCKPIGSASATSPLYPRPLTGKAYLTGSPTAPAITIAFPAPFALTLNGAVDLATNTTTFNDLPDIPLTDLKVTLAGGPDAVFVTDCKTPSGTASSTLTTQNGDRTVTTVGAASARELQRRDLRRGGSGRERARPGGKPGRRSSRRRQCPASRAASRSFVSSCRRDERPEAARVHGRAAAGCGSSAIATAAGS